MCYTLLQVIGFSISESNNFIRDCRHESARTPEVTKKNELI